VVLGGRAQEPGTEDVVGSHGWWGGHRMVPAGPHGR